MSLPQSSIDKIISLARSYGATRLILFGSAIKLDTQPGDIDLACDGIQGWKLYELASRLEEELQTPLDIIPLTPESRFTRHIQSHGRVLL